MLSSEVIEKGLQGFIHQGHVAGQYRGDSRQVQDFICQVKEQFRAEFQPGRSEAQFEDLLQQLLRKSSVYGRQIRYGYKQGRPGDQPTLLVDQQKHKGEITLIPGHFHRCRKQEYIALEGNLPGNQFGCFFSTFGIPVGLVNNGPVLPAGHLIAVHPLKHSGGSVGNPDQDFIIPACQIRKQAGIAFSLLQNQVHLFQQIGQLVQGLLSGKVGDKSGNDLFKFNPPALSAESDGLQIFFYPALPGR